MCKLPRICKKRSSKTHPSAAETYEYKNIASKQIQPSEYADSEASLSVRFSRDYLMSLLHAFIKESTSSPLEKWEIDLFNHTKSFNTNLQSEPITMHCIEKVHHVQKLINKQIYVEGISEDTVEDNVRMMSEDHPFIFAHYSVFVSMIEMWNILLVKWNIGHFKAYDYRCTGRALNVKMLNLAEINEKFLSMDMIWISTQVVLKPLNVLATSKLIEYVRILHSQLELALRLFLDINEVKNEAPKHTMKNSASAASSDFRNWEVDQIPHMAVNSRPASLKLPSGIFKCFQHRDQKVEAAARALVDLELAYRCYEKTLIGNILDITGKADF